MLWLLGQVAVGGRHAGQPKGTHLIEGRMNQHGHGPSVYW